MAGRAVFSPPCKMNFRPRRRYTSTFFAAMRLGVQSTTTSARPSNSSSVPVRAHGGARSIDEKIRILAKAAG